MATVEKETSAAFVKYKVFAKQYSDLLHPADVVESLTMSLVQPITPTYRHALPEDFLRQAVAPLSGVQIDTVILAGQAHSIMLPDEERQGFVLGDGTGVGKGRCIAGIILDNYLQGRKKSVWVSCSLSLIEDAKRDIRDITRNSDFSIPVLKLPRDYSDINFEKGVLFLTYASLGTDRKTKPNRETPRANPKPRNSKTAFKKEHKSRFDQVIQTLGRKFDGLIIFDESHQAKGYVDDVQKKSSKRGDAVRSLQDILTFARIVYVSATVATEPDEIQYMSRLGLWGSGTVFNDALAFVQAVKDRGICGNELVAIELKKKGLLLSRHLSFEGIEFSVKSVSSSQSYKETVNACSKLWIEMYKYLRFVENLSSNHISTYWAEHQKFFSHLCVGAKVPALINIIRETINNKENPRSVVIGIQSTGEAAYSKFRVDKFHDRDEEACSPCLYGLEFYLVNTLKISRELLGLKIRRTAYNTKERLKVSNTKSPASKKPKLHAKVEANLSDSEDDSAQQVDDEESGDDSDSEDSNDDAEIQFDDGWGEDEWEDDDESDNEELTDSEKKKLKEELICKLFHKVKDQLPVNVVDRIKLEFDYSLVTELTGRKLSQFLVFDGNRYIRSKREIFDNSELNTRMDLFLNGKAKIAIISEAASTGISLHSNKKYKNQDQRLHIILEAPWSATSVCQQMGRTNRSNQVSKPEYVLLMSDIPGESRFASALAGRMINLGAFCKGDRRTSHEVWGKYAQNETVARKAINELLKCVCGMKCQMQIFLGSDGETKRLQHLKVLKDMNLIHEKKRTPIGPNTKFTNYAKFLNRVVGMPIQYQKELLEWLGLAIEKINSQQGPETTAHIEDLQKVADATVSLSKTIPFQLPGSTLTTLYLFESRTITLWEDLQNLENLSFFSKQYKNGNVKVVGATKQQRLGLIQSYSWTVYKFHRNLEDPQTKGKRHFLENKYKPISKAEAEKFWKRATSFVKPGICTKAFKNGICREKSKCLANHSRPVNEMAVLVGGCFSLWSFIDCYLNGIQLVRVSLDDVTTVGLFIPPKSVDKVKQTLTIKSSKTNW